MKKLIVVAISLGFFAVSQAHDEGHGPRSKGIQPNKGGIVAAIVNKKDVSKGEKADGVYWAELYRDSQGNASVYVYKKELKKEDHGKERLETLNTEKFASKAVGEMHTKVKGKWQTVTFDFEKKQDAFVAKIPKAKVMPYNIDVTFKEGENEFLTAFDNLD